MCTWKIRRNFRKDSWTTIRKRLLERAFYLSRTSPIADWMTALNISWEMKFAAFRARYGLHALRSTTEGGVTVLFFFCPLHFEIDPHCRKQFYDSCKVSRRNFCRSSVKRAIWFSRLWITPRYSKWYTCRFARKQYISSMRFCSRKPSTFCQIHDNASTLFKRWIVYGTWKRVFQFIRVHHLNARTICECVYSKLMCYLKYMHVYTEIK